MKLEVQLSVKSFLILLIFEKIYLVNFGPNFVGLFLLSGDNLGKTNYLGFISAYTVRPRFVPLLGPRKSSTNQNSIHRGL